MLNWIVGPALMFVLAWLPDPGRPADRPIDDVRDIRDEIARRVRQLVTEL